MNIWPKLTFWPLPFHCSYDLFTNNQTAQICTFGLFDIFLYEKVFNGVWPLFFSGTSFSYHPLDMPVDVKKSSQLADILNLLWLPWGGWWSVKDYNIINIKKLLIWLTLGVIGHIVVYILILPPYFTRYCCSGISNLRSFQEKEETVWTISNGYRSKVWLY